MRKKIGLIALLILEATVSSHAVINIDTVLVADPGNAADSTGFGAVNYEYRIGTYEVTNSQYTAFLNDVAVTDTHGLYNASMASSSVGGINRTGSSGNYTYSVKSGMDSKPVNFVSFWDAARFTNWLTSGDTEVGVYNLGGVTSPTNNTITRDATAWANGGVAVASENEWYKSAYYNPTTGSYTHFVGNDAAPTAEAPPGGTNSANYLNALGNVTDVGSYSQTITSFGTYDQAGNVEEWLDTISDSESVRRLRGSNYNRTIQDTSSGDYQETVSDNEGGTLGFRVTSLEPIPEPATFAVFFGLLAFIFTVCRRRQ